MNKNQLVHGLSHVGRRFLRRDRTGLYCIVVMFVRVRGRWRRGRPRPLKIRSSRRSRFAFALHLPAPIPFPKQVLKHVGDVPNLVPVLGRDFEERETELVAEFDAFEMRDHAVLAVEIVLVADEHAGYLRRLEDVLDGALAVDDGFEAVAIGDRVDEEKGVAPDRVPATMTKIVLAGKRNDLVNSHGIKFNL